MSKVGDLVGGIFGGDDGGGSGGEPTIFGMRLPLLKRVKEVAEERQEERQKALQIQEIESARRRAGEAERLRKGRSASILTSARGVTEPLGSASRPRASSLLGG